MITQEIVNGAMCFVQSIVYRKSVEGEMKVVAVKRLLDNITKLPVAILEEKVIGPARKS